jgi:hypothetical protein
VAAMVLSLYEIIRIRGKLPLSPLLFYNMESLICPKCGLVDDYNIQQRGNHKTAYCNGCDSYIKHLPQGNPTALYFGKYKGRQLESMTTPEELKYLKWLNDSGIKQNSLKEAVTKHLAKY